MTQHVMTEHTEEDIRTMKSLGKFVGLFAAFALCLALGVTFVAG